MKQNSSVSIESPLPRQIGKLFEEHGSEYVFLNHRPCRSAEESSATRAAAGGKPDVGAKALLCKLQLSTCEEFVVFALPGPARLSSKAIRIALPQLKGLRFATAAELLEITGVVPGALPPFGAPIFPKVDRLIVDEALLDAHMVGFNAGLLTCSIVVSSDQFITVARPNVVCRISK